MMHVILLPGKGHDRHNHPESDEILYILAGEGDQMVDDDEPKRVRPGDTVFIPMGAFHSTLNTGYEPMVILAIYALAGAEEVLKTLPDYQELPPARRRRCRAGDLVREERAEDPRRRQARRGGGLRASEEADIVHALRGDPSLRRCRWSPERSTASSSATCCSAAATER